MKRLRDKRGRFAKKRVEKPAPLYAKVLVGIMIGGFFSTIVYEEYKEWSKPLYAFVEETEVVETVQPKEVKLQVVIDWTDERIEQEIRNVFIDDPDVAVAVAWAESQLNKNALNPEKHRGCSGSRGIFQIACVHGDKPDDLFDVQYNIKKAYEIYKSQGWQPWGAYTDGNYKKYLD